MTADAPVAVVVPPPVTRCVLLERSALVLLLAAAERDLADLPRPADWADRMVLHDYPTPAQERALRRAVRLARALLADG